jgi:SAM-dependent methyltransferase
MSVDPDEQRRASLDAWERSSAGWRRRAGSIATWSAPVAHWLVEAIHPQPGHRVLELAAGPGETGLLAAELIEPGGELISTDQAEGMVAAARARAEEMGIKNAQFKVMDAEWIDLPLAHVDGVICRWGFMLMTDPGAALRETRRVLKPGGRLALAVWDTIDGNPWGLLPRRALERAGYAAPPPPPGAPGPFALSDPVQVRELLEQAGFQEIEQDVVDLLDHYEDAEEFWNETLDLSGTFRTAIAELDRDQRAQVRAALDVELEPYAQPDGTVQLPRRALVAAAQA